MLNNVKRAGEHSWMSRIPGTLILVILTVLLAGSGAFAQAPVQIVLEEGVNSYAGTRDATLYEESTNSNGGGEFLFAGNTNALNARRSLIAFDLSSIPSGSLILAVSLELTISMTSSLATVQQLHRLDADWGEGSQDAISTESTGTASASGDATWVSRFVSSATWTSPGGDYQATASASASPNAIGSTPLWTSAQMAADVQDWLDAPASNWGWILIGDESTFKTTKRYFSSDSTAPAGQKPRLTVRYQSSGSHAENWRLYN